MFQAPRGTQDILPEDEAYWRFLEDQIHGLVALYGYRYLSTPIFEDTSLFVRGVGEVTDIVEKEMYSFADKGNDSITLRPEFTAGVVRAYLEHGMHVQAQPVKLYSLGPVFRYDRPQAGRYRQFTQVNFESIGELDPAVDAEVIALSFAFYRAVGLGGVSMQLNSIGCPRCRPAYVAALTQYYAGRAEELCGDCRGRLNRNPLRLLDCKVPSCQPLASAAPRTAEHLCPECQDHFARLREYLDLAGIPYTLNPRLVRGLDYYTKTTFEFWPTKAGSQSSLGGGGRYDGLAQAIGGRPTPGIGVALGMERIVLELKAQNAAIPPLPGPTVAVVTFGEEARRVGIGLLTTLRAGGVNTVMTFGQRSFKAQMKQAAGLGVRYTMLLGDDEVKAGAVTVRDMMASSQETVSIAGALRLAGGDRFAAGG
jgi:histidyl-tRNA synthetase